MESLVGRDLLKLSDLTPAELSYLLQLAQTIKACHKGEGTEQTLQGKRVGIILQKPSLRTRVSFEVACGLLGAQPIILEGANNVFSRGENTKDTVCVLQRYLDALVIRTFSDDLLAEIASHATIPVINALTDGYHPCQGLADLLTMQERFNTLAGLTLAYVGDGSNNMAHTYIEAGALGGMHVRIGTPDEYPPRQEVYDEASRIAQQTGASFVVTSDPREAVEDANIVVTDTWVSMGQETQQAQRVDRFSRYQVNTSLMGLANSDAIFLHCLPAHRGQEVTDEVIDSASSYVYDEAENRLHAQAALLQAVLGKEKE